MCLEAEPKSRQAKHVKKRRLEGMCGWEGCQENPGVQYYCLTHRRLRRERMRRSRSGLLKRAQP